MNTYHIVNERGEFWSREKNRWGDDRDATIFTERDASTLELPNDGHWKIII